jgi:hypothetical protein
MQHYLIGLYKRYEFCLLIVTNWIALDCKRRKKRQKERKEEKNMNVQ